MAAGARLRFHRSADNTRRTTIHISFVYALGLLKVSEVVEDTLHPIFALFWLLCLFGSFRGCGGYST